MTTTAPIVNMCCCSCPVSNITHLYSVINHKTVTRHALSPAALFSATVKKSQLW